MVRWGLPWAILGLFSCAQGVADDEPSGGSQGSTSSTGSGSTSTSGAGAGTGTGSGGAGAGSTSGSGGAGAGSTSGSGGAGATGTGGTSAGTGGAGGSGTGGVGGGGTGGSGSPCGNGTLPLQEDFEGSGLPVGWSHVDGSNSSLHWETGAGHNSTNAAFHDDDIFATDNDYLVSSAIDLSNCAGFNVTLTFWERNTLSSYYEGHFIVHTTQSNPSSPSAFTPLQEVGVGSSTWAQRSMSLNSLIGQSAVRIAFRYTGYNADNWFIDDMSIDAI